MCENVNINVSETNETINIVATEVQEVIDINVFETAEDVTLNITEQLIQVNVNKVTAAEQIQSDWAQTDNEALDFIKNKPTIPANTSDLVNDGEDGVNPFITANDIPPVTGFVPYTGATEDVNLGEFGLLTGNVEFDNTPTNIPTSAGAMYWNDADGTADLILKGGNVKLQLGQESVIRVVNKTATNINLLEANYQAVRVTGAQGQRLKVDLAQATTDNLSAETIGLVTETINNNQEGFITTSGLVRNINTTGSLQGETWADGDILYLSPTTAGNVTKVKPTAPNHLVIIGYVVHAHANQGNIFVKVDNGYELDELHNVKITSAANNNVLAYTSATDIWENKTVETALGYTPQQELVSGTNIKTINGSSVLGSGDLVVGGSTSLAIGTTPITSGTIGRVLFQGTGDVLQQSANLFWDNTNGRLGINNAAPANSLDIDGTFRVTSGANSLIDVNSTYTTLNRNLGTAQIMRGLSVTPTSGTFGFGTGAGNTGTMSVGDGTNFAVLGYNWSPTGAKAVFAGITQAGNQLPIAIYGRKFELYNTNSVAMTMFDTTRNFVIQSGGTHVDSGHKLNVNGTIKFGLYGNLNGNISSNIGEFLQPSTLISSGNYNIGLGSQVSIASNATIGIYYQRTNFDFALTSAVEVRGTGDGSFSDLRLMKSGGSVLIGTTTAIASSLLTMNSTTRGFLPPRMTTTEKNAIATPAAGLMIYDNTLNRPCFYDGTTWITL